MKFSEVVSISEKSLFWEGIGKICLRAFLAALQKRDFEPKVRLRETSFSVRTNYIWIKIKKLSCSSWNWATFCHNGKYRSVKEFSGRGRSGSKRLKSEQNLINRECFEQCWSIFSDMTRSCSISWETRQFFQFLFKYNLFLPKN